MKEPIQDRVGVGWVTDGAVPGCDVELAGDDRGFTSVAVLEDFEEIMAGLSVERLKPPVVEDQEFDLAEALELARDATIAAR